MNNYEFQEQFPFREPVLILDNQYFQSPLIQKIDGIIQNDNLNKRPLSKIYLVSLIMLALNYMIIFICCLITLKYFFIKKFVIQYPLIYTFCWCLLITSCAAIHCYPHIIQKYPFNYYIFLATFFSRGYIYFFICIYFREINGHIFALLAFIIIFFTYFRFQIGLQKFSTQSQLQQYVTPSQRTLEDGEQSESDDEGENWNLALEDEKPRQETKQESSHNQSEDQMGQEIVGKNEDEEQNQDILTDEQRSMLESQHELITPNPEEKKEQLQQQQTNILPNEEEEESDFMKEFDLKQFEERISTYKLQKQQEKKKKIELELNPIIIPPPTIEEVLTTRKIIIPEEYFLFKNSWLFYLLLSIIAPLLVFFMFNPKFPIIFVPIVCFFTFIYIWLVQLHLQFYITDYRSYVIQGEVSNSYYLSLAYMEADFIFPWLFIVENDKIRNIKMK